MEFTNEELAELYDIISDRVYYGDDEIVYTEKGDLARSIMRKVINEAKARKFWWAR